MEGEIKRVFCYLPTSFFLEFGLEEGTETALSLRTHMYILLKCPDKKKSTYNTQQCQMATLEV